ncbi:hypothetical protein A7D21_27335 [Pseudomonas sp. AP19]|uniref:hypothetical protein n=1 Tax=Pseudomonas TaxID=286 RepID=UPI00084B37B8|nr:hypothetical protein [Pseudomonas sp. AP19]OEC68252.1 hypothetical protein A7D21_27335 [Pseudomonas sp. AP19]
MYHLLEIAVLFIIAPYILFGVVLGAVAGLIINLFQPAVLMTSVWFAVLGAYLSTSRTDPNQGFVSLLGMVTDSQILGVSVPSILLGIGGVLLIVALLCRQRR